MSYPKRFLAALRNFTEYNYGMRILLIAIALVVVALVGWLTFKDTPAVEEEVINNNGENSMTISIQLTSSAFEYNGSIPSKYTCDENGRLSPPLSISGVPEKTVSLALIMDDPDVPKQLRPEGVFDHWVLFNIPATTKEIPEGTSVGTLGANSGGVSTYTGPCPPSQYEPSEHRYVFKLYALDAELDLEPGATKEKVLEAMRGHVIADAELIGRYKRQ